MAHFQPIPFLNSPLARCPCDCVRAVSEVQSEHSTGYTMPAEERKATKCKGPTLLTLHSFSSSDSSLHVTTLSSMPASELEFLTLSRASSCSCAPFRGLLSPATSLHLLYDFSDNKLHLWLQHPWLHWGCPLDGDCHQNNWWINPFLRLEAG